MLKRLYTIILRECKILSMNPMYLLCMVILPLFVMVYFTSLLQEGQPQEMPVGIVDNDNTSTTRALIRRLDAMQTSNVVAHYATVSEARAAIQHGEIYAFMHFPEGTTEKLLASRRPKIAFYYSNTSLTAGSLLYKDMKTVATLGSAAVGQAVMRAKGLTDKQIMALLQPVAIDAHSINNPCVNYNMYLSTMLVPACFMLFIMLMTTYSLGMELKKRNSKKLMDKAGGNILVALVGKFLPQTLIHMTMMNIQMFYLFEVLGFTHQGSVLWIIFLAFMAVLAAEGFGIIIFGLMPSQRMSMSICCLWGVLSFSLAGTAFPIFAMDAPLQAVAWLFPMRHYWLIYSLNIFNSYPMADTWINVMFLLGFILLPILFAPRIKKVMNTYVYMP